jgi:predicted phosphodiesterase
MNILILSDLHIDKGDNIGLFRWDDEEFIDCVEKIRQFHSVDRIVLNGDIFELLKYSFKEIEEARPALFRYLLNNDFIMLSGNHDLTNPYARESYTIANTNGQIIHIEHGYKADWFNGNFIGRALGKITFSLLKKVSKNGLLMKFYFSLVRRNERINAIPKKYNTLTYLTYALTILKEYDLVILGHTHKLESHHSYYMNMKKRYINCGSCSLGRFEGIILNTETMVYELIKETKETMKAVFSLTYTG